MIVFEVKGKVPVGLTDLMIRHIAKEVWGVLPAREKRSAWSIVIAFVSATAIARLNRAYRHISAPTDVLSFENTGGDGRLWRGGERSDAGRDERGDILICPSYARKEAVQRSVPYIEELVRLVVHGSLHLFGYDHERVIDERKMLKAQEAIVARVLHDAGKGANGIRRPSKL
jgi:probable rRNA maturation factor